MKTFEKLFGARLLVPWISILLLSLSDASLSGQSCLRWVLRTDVGSPGPRYGHSLAYDHVRGVTVFFGGEYSEVGGDPEYYNDVWTYDGAQWRQVPIVGQLPTPRSWASLSARDGVVTLGQGIGYNGVEESEWELRIAANGTGTWQLIPRNPVFDSYRIWRPRGHENVGGVWDPLDEGNITSRREAGPNSPFLPFDVADFAGVYFGLPGYGGTLILGGGQFSEADPTDDPTLIEGPLVELMVVRHEDGSEAWERISCGLRPGNRYQASAAYDSTRDRVVMFGSAADTHWELARRNPADEENQCFDWKQMNLSPMPESRAHAKMVYDSKRKVTILFGGIGGPQFTRFGDTWELTQVPPTLYQVGPTNFEVCASQPFTLYTSIGGNPPYQIQWFGEKLGGTCEDPPCDYARPGETNSSFTTSEWVAGVYLYSYTVRDACDNLNTSVTYHVTVHEKPYVSTIQDRVEGCPGENRAFSISVTSALPYTLQWYHNDQAIGAPRNFLAGQHTNILALTNLVPAHSGIYRVTAANICGVGSNFVHGHFNHNTEESERSGTLRVGPVLVQDPASATAPVCGTNSLKVRADGVGRMRYQWRLDGLPLTNDSHFSGVNTNVLRMRELLYSHGGNYDVIVWDDCGPHYAVTSRVAVLTITPGPQWVYRTNSTPPPARYRHTMVYDSARRVTVMFGGYFNSPTNFGVYNDIWEWNGSHWIQRAPQEGASRWSRNAQGHWYPNYSHGPVARAEHAMTYDARRGRIVIFGGTAVDPGGSLQYLNDTWEWDGSRWYFRGTNGPAWRSAAGMTFNSARNVSVLFGGVYYSGEPAPGALWEWDGTLWKTNATVGNFAPFANSISMTYDSFRNNILYGPTVNFNGIIYDIFWLLNGSNWTAHSAFNVRDDPLPYGNLVFDSYRRRPTYTFGRKGEVGFWDGTSWTTHTNPPAPALRFWHGAAFDSDRRAVVMFGGTFGYNQYYVNTNDTWELVYLDKPLIQQQPLSQVRQLNDIATFSVAAVGPGPLTYQWLRNGQPLANDFRISGATSNVLRIASVFRDDETLFQVRVSGACGTTLSRPVLLTLNTNLQILNVAGEPQVMWSQSSAVLEQADDPGGPWTPVPGANSPFNPNMAASLKFFRLRLLP